MVVIERENGTEARLSGASVSRCANASPCRHKSSARAPFAAVWAESLSCKYPDSELNWDKPTYNVNYPSFRSPVYLTLSFGKSREGDEPPRRVAEPSVPTHGSSATKRLRKLI